MPEPPTPPPNPDSPYPLDDPTEPPYAGPERRKGPRRATDDSDSDDADRRTGLDQRGLDRRRGPGRRRTDQRRAAEEGEMDDEQFTFIMAIDEYKRANKRPFPTYTEILEIAKALGYRKVADPKPLNQIGKEEKPPAP